MRFLSQTIGLPILIDRSIDRPTTLARQTVIADRRGGSLNIGAVFAQSIGVFVVTVSRRGKRVVSDKQERATSTNRTQQRDDAERSQKRKEPVNTRTDKFHDSRELGTDRIVHGHQRSSIQRERKQRCFLGLPVTHRQRNPWYLPRSLVIELLNYYSYNSYYTSSERAINYLFLERRVNNCEVSVPDEERHQSPRITTALSV